MFKKIIKLCVFSFISFLLIVPNLDAQNNSEQNQTQSQDEYTESGLRRFEIVTLSSLPFTAVHSYLGVRGIQMVQQNKIAPVLTSNNYRIMGISAVSLSLFIGIWDWVHTRNIDRSAPSIPQQYPQSPPNEQEIPDDGSIARAPIYGPYPTTMIQHIPSFNSFRSMQAIDSKLNGLRLEPTLSIALTLLEIRF